MSGARFSRLVICVTRERESLATDRGTAALRLVLPQNAKSDKLGHRTQNPALAQPRGKTGRVLELLQRPGGATLKQLIAATQWQAHSVRGFLSGALKKKMGLKIQSKEAAGERSYSIQA
jgi:Protein of unknown function (DUF3489)